MILKQSQRILLRTQTQNFLTKTLIHTLQSHPQQQHGTANSSASRLSAQRIAAELSNCSNIQDLNHIHARIITNSSDVKVLSNPYLWNNIIRSYVRLDSPYEALGVYVSMSRANVLPDFYTMPIVLKGVCQAFDLQIGIQVHCVAVKLGLDLFEFCESGFINMYAKAGEFDNARKVFDQSPEKNLGSWNAIISGLTHAGKAREAITMFVELMKSGLEPDDVTMVSVTSACGSLGDLNLALQLHKCVFQAKTFARTDVMMMNSLIDMYGKCGQMELAYKVFEEMGDRNVLSWTSLINGYAMHGHVKEALECFHRMRESWVNPNHVTFVGVLSACVHGGLVEEGRFYFNMMRNVYRISPMLQHYGVMVDLLGRAGLLNEAREMVERMPLEPNAIIWGALMGACEKHGNVEMGEWVAKHLEILEPWNDGVYVVLSNIYASAGLWEKVNNIRMIMKGRGVAKVPAYSLTTNSA
ncbi:hypothetical protein ACHQM5_028712 [Ranunculus cassubicifolius]